MTRIMVHDFFMTHEGWNISADIKLSDLCKYYFMPLSLDIIPFQNWETGYKITTMRFPIVLEIHSG